LSENLATQQIQKTNKTNKMNNNEEINNNNNNNFQEDDMEGDEDGVYFSSFFCCWATCLFVELTNSMYMLYSSFTHCLLNRFLIGFIWRENGWNWNWIHIETNSQGTLFTF
jgi:hypothetical protein